MDRARILSIVDCGHPVMCIQCFQYMLTKEKNHNNIERAVCRVKVTAAIAIFM